MNKLKQFLISLLLIFSIVNFSIAEDQLTGSIFVDQTTGSVTTVTGTSPISSSGGATPAISIQDAAADGTTKGAATFNATNFSAAAGVINTIQGISTAATPTFAGLTCPTVIGGIGTTSDLNLKTTSGVGATGADMHFLVGNNGATEAATILNNGNMGLNTVAPSARLTLNYDGLGNQSTPPTTGYYGLLLENNTTVASAVRESTGGIYFKSHGWTGAIDQIVEHALWSNAAVDGNPLFRVFVREGGSGAFTSIQDIDSTGIYRTSIRHVATAVGEALSVGLLVGNTTNATNTVDQYAPYFGTYSQGWKSAATAGTQYMSLGQVLAPQQGTISPIGVYDFFYGINTSTPVLSQSIMQLKFGSDAGVTGVVFNNSSENDYTMKVVGATDANLFVVDGTNDRIGIGVAAGAITARLHLPAGTATASTSPLKIPVGTALAVAEAGSINHVGNTTDSTFTVTPYIGSVATVKTLAYTDSKMFDPPTVVNGATYDVLATDTFLMVTRTSSGTCAIDIKSAQITTSGWSLIIKDAGGLAGTNNITITTEGAETIDGSATLPITANYGSRSLKAYNGNLYIY